MQIFGCVRVRYCVCVRDFLRAVMSSNSDTDVVLRGVKHGAVDYLLKPVAIKELRNIWQHVVRQRATDENCAMPSGQGISQGRETLPPDSRKRKDGMGMSPSDGDGKGGKKQCIVWTADLHQKFVNAVNMLGIESTHTLTHPPFVCNQYVFPRTFCCIFAASRFPSDDERIDRLTKTLTCECAYTYSHVHRIRPETNFGFDGCTRPHEGERREPSSEVQALPQEDEIGGYAGIAAGGLESQRHHDERRRGGEKSGRRHPGWQWCKWWWC